LRCSERTITVPYGNGSATARSFSVQTELEVLVDAKVRQLLAQLGDELGEMVIGVVTEVLTEAFAKEREITDAKIERLESMLKSLQHGGDHVQY
jgi:hypothetical protein